MTGREFDWIDPFDGRVVRSGTYAEDHALEVVGLAGEAGSRRGVEVLRGVRVLAPGSRGPRLDVHHKTYARLGCEAPEDLEVLCRACHDERHTRRATPIPPDRQETS